MSNIDTSAAAIRGLLAKNFLPADVVLAMIAIAAEKEVIEGIQSEFAPEKFGGIADSLYAMSAEMRRLRAEVVKKEMSPVYQAFADPTLLSQTMPIPKRTITTLEAAYKDMLAAPQPAATSDAGFQVSINGGQWTGPEEAVISGNSVTLTVEPSDAGAVPEGWVPLTITFEEGYPEEVAYGPKRMMDRLKKWLDKFYELRLAAAPEAPQPEPIDMVLHCPACGLQHIDEPDWCPVASQTEFAPLKWTNPPHRSHLCKCGHIWRPADVPTNGVQAVQTKGKADSLIAQPSVRGPLSDAELVALFDEARNGSSRPVGTLRGIRAVLSAHGITGTQGGCNG